MRKRTTPKFFGLLIAAALILGTSLLATSCGSSVNMHKHSRSHCDCPSF